MSLFDIVGNGSVRQSGKRVCREARNGFLFVTAGDLRQGGLL